MNGKKTVKDPICGMEVDPERAVKAGAGGKEYFFCSTHCREKFLQREGLGSTAACSPAVKKSIFQNKIAIISSALVLIVFLSYFFPLLTPLRKALLMYLSAIWWAVALGLVLGGVIDHYIPREYISKILARKKPSTILNAVFLGFLMSACSHGILALAIQLHKKGASNPAVVAFLLASPWANFAITVMLVSLFGVKGVAIIIAALIVATSSGFIFLLLEKKGLIEKNINIIDVAEHFSILQDIQKRRKEYRLTPASVKNDVRGIVAGAGALAEMVLWWILLGVFLASIAGAYIPVHFFHQFMGPTIAGLLVTLALATVIEVCSEGSAPLAFEIYRQGGALGNSFTFLMAGVATDYTEIGLLWTNVGRRVALWLPLVTVPQILILGYLFNIIFK